MPSARTNRLLAALLALTFTAFFTATTHGAFRFGDDAVYFEVTQALVDRQAFDVTPVPKRGRNARADGPGDGESYSKYGVGLSLAAVPAYLAGRALAEPGGLPEERDGLGRSWTGALVFATSLTNAVVAGLTVAALFFLVLELGHTRRCAALVAGSLGATTYFAHYGTTFLSEPLSALLLTGAVTAALRASTAYRGGRIREASTAAALAGAAAGGALLVRVAHLVAIVAIGIWLLLVLVRTRRPGDSSQRLRALAVLTAWATPVALGLALVALYNFVRFGLWFETGYGREADNFDTPWVQGLAGLLISPGKGWPWYAPPLLLAIPGWILLARRRPAAAALLGVVLLSVLALFARYYMWWGGGSWGPRFLVPITPLALAPAAELLRAERRAPLAARALVRVPIVAGAFVVLLAILVPFPDYQQAPSIREIRAQPTRPIGVFWSVADSPLVTMARQMPRHAWTTVRLLVGSEAMPATGELRGFPDLAATRYRSAGLLSWTRWWLVVASVSGAATLLALRRAVAADEPAEPGSG